MTKNISVQLVFQTRHHVSVSVPEGMSTEEFERRFGHMLQCVHPLDLQDGWVWKTQFGHETCDVVFEGGADHPLMTQVLHVDVEDYNE